jgi:hypothetical protein
MELAVFKKGGVETSDIITRAAVIFRGPQKAQTRGRRNKLSSISIGFQKRVIYAI